MSELAFDCGDGRFVRLADDDGLDLAEWVLLDTSDPHRSTTLTAEQALDAVLPDERAECAWSALAVWAATAGRSEASLPPGANLQMLDADTRERIRWWFRHLGPGA